MAEESNTNTLAAKVLSATLENDLETLKDLLEKTEVPIRKRVNDTTALHASAQKCQPESTLLLLQHGWHPDLQDARKRTALHVATSTEVASALLQFQADPSLKDAKGLTPLAVAIWTRKLDFVELLLDHSPPSCVTEALPIAAVQSSKAILKSMIDRGYDINVRNGSKSATALHMVASAGKVEDVIALLELGAQVDPLDVQGASPLHWAALGGKLESVQALVAAGAKINRIDTAMGGTPLFAAIQSLNVDLVKWLIAHGAEYQKTVAGRTMLHLAAQNGSPRITECLLQAGIDPNVLDEYGGTAARWAAENGHIETMEMLHSFGCDVLRADGRGWTPLHSAVHRGQTEAVRYLLDLGASPSAMTNDGVTPAVAAVQGKHSVILALLLDEGVQPTASLVRLAIMKEDISSVKQIISICERYPSTMDTLRADGGNDIMLAVKNECYDIARVLIASGYETATLKPEDKKSLFLSAVIQGFHDVVLILAKTGQLDRRMSLEESLMTPVHIAAETGDIDMIRTLIDLGFPTSDESQYGQTALHFAATKGHTDVVKMLISTTNVLLKDVNEATALHWAVTNNHLEVVKLLSQAHGALSATNNNKHTPLHLACERGHYECAKVLLEAGSDATAKDAILRTAAHLAAASRSPDSVKIISLLEEWGSTDTDSKTVRGITPLGYAANAGNLDAVKYLAVRGADFRARDDARHTPLHIAVMSGHAEVARFLLGLEPGLKADPTVIAELWYCASTAPDLPTFELLAEECSIGTLSLERIVEILNEVVRKGDDESCSFFINLLARSNKQISNNVALRALMITSKRGLMETSRHLASMPGLKDESYLGASPVQSALVHKNKQIAAMLLRCGFLPPPQELLETLAQSDTEASSDASGLEDSGEESDSE